MKDSKKLKVIFVAVAVVLITSWAVLRKSGQHSGNPSDMTGAGVSQDGSQGTSSRPSQDGDVERQATSGMTTGNQERQVAGQIQDQATSPLNGAPQGAPVAGGQAPGGQSHDSTSQQVIAPGAPHLTSIAPEPTCFKYSFTHRRLSAHSDAEACSHHQNLIRLKHTNINPKSLCVRVNDVPVAFQKVKGKSNEFIVPPVAGPRAKITAQYCLGKEKCSQDCKVKKDDFMAAIGADTLEVGKKGRKPAAVVQWDPNDQTSDHDVSAEVEAEVNRELAGFGGSTLTLFKDWISSEPEAPTCGTDQANTSKKAQDPASRS